MEGFQAFVPFPFENAWKPISTGHGKHENIQRRTSAGKCKHFFTWLNAESSLFPLFFYLLEVLPSNVAPPRWRKKQCVWVCAELPLWNKIDGTYYTRSHFKTSLNQVAEGWIPLNSLWSYCMLWSVALNPHRSSCGYQTHLFYGDSPAHNSPQVIQNPAGTFTSNLHLFHHYMIKEYIRILGFICIFWHESSVCFWVDASVPDWMTMAPRLLFSLSFR